MTQITDPAAEAPCASCGGPLPAPVGERTVRCGHCNAAQPNPRPLPVGHEVIFGGSSAGSFRLGTVLSARGPDAIEVSMENGPQVRRLEDLTPVVAVSDALPERSRVFVREGSFGWHATELARIEDGVCVVKHENESFQDPFFDRKALRGDVRQPLRPLPVKRRPWWSALPSWSTVAMAIVFAALCLVWVARC